MAEKKEKKAEVEEKKFDFTEAFINRRLKAINQIPNPRLRKTLAEAVLLNRKGK